MCVIAEMSAAWGGVDWALGEGVFSSERASTRTCDVIVGEGTVFEGVAGGEVVVSKVADGGGGIFAAC